MKNVTEELTKIRREDGKWNFIDKKGNILSPNMWFKAISRFHDGFASVKREDGKWNIIDTKGNIISPNLWFDITDTYTKPFIAFINHEHYYFDKKYKPHKDILLNCYNVLLSSYGFKSLKL